VKFCQNLTYTGRYDLPEMLIEQPIDIPTAVTHKSLTVWSRLMDHEKVERVVFENGIQDIQSFGLSETGKLKIRSTTVLSRNSFSSFVDAQNSVTSKPLVRWGCISNQWKPKRVLFDFGIQLQVEFHVEQSRCHCFLILLLIEAKQS
jgi:hypothetical protein